MVKTTIKYQQFELLSLGERIDWIDTIVYDELTTNHTHLEIKHFFKAIYDSETNIYLRKKAIVCIAELTLLNVVRYEYTKDFLLEEVSLINDSFIVSTKLKYLFLLFGDDQDVYNELNEASRSELSEVAAEANFRLGLIHFFYRACKNSLSIVLEELDKAKRYFNYVNTISENRTDAYFFESLITYIMALLSGSFSDSQTDYQKLLQIIWQREAWGWLTGTELLEYHILSGLKNLNCIVKTTTQEPNWIEYKKELLTLNKSFNDLILNVSLNKKFLKSYNTFTQNIATEIVEHYYSRNLSACEQKIDALIEHAEPEEQSFKDFLIDIKVRLQAHKEKKNVSSLSVTARLYRTFPKITLEKIKQDVNQLSSQGIAEINILAELGIKYASQQNINRVDFLTGYKVGDEVLQTIENRIRALLPKYPNDSLAILISVLSDLIRYQYQSLILDKSFFDLLYDSNIKVEKAFQDHLFSRLISGNRATYYRYEETGTVGASRLDIVYKELDLTYPIEVKKTEIKPNWEIIKADYMAQAQTYSTPYSQLSFLVVFDISTKKGEAPVDDFRSLSEILHLTPYYNISNNHPDYVVCLIIPGNKISPSKYTKYN